jgi:hypothetical protein
MLKNTSAPEFTTCNYNHNPDYQNRTVRRWRLCPLRCGEGRYRPLHAVSGAGSRALRYHRKLHRPQRDRDRSDHGDRHSGQHPEQPRSGRIGRLVSVPLQALMVGWGDVAEGREVMERWAAFCNATVNFST